MTDVEAVQIVMKLLLMLSSETSLPMKVLIDGGWLICLEFADW